MSNGEMITMQLKEYRYLSIICLCVVLKRFLLRYQCVFNAINIPIANYTYLYQQEHTYRRQNAKISILDCR
jgi:hypothetical protein